MNYEEKKTEEVCISRIVCSMCDYSLSKEEFDYGKGRLMFCEGPHIEKGKVVCGVCDERGDSDGEYLADESDEEKHPTSK